jgi:uncharacterized membrane protein
MPKSTLAGHPLHPMLIVAPAALIPFGFILDAMARSTDNDDYANAAYYSLAGGLIGGIAAGVAGAMDYMAIESETDVKRTANVHAMLNGGALALTAANVALRRNDYKQRATASRWQWARLPRWAYWCRAGSAARWSTNKACA